MRTIALEEHCLTPELRELLGSQIHPYYPAHRWPPALEARLLDLGEGRIAEMDAQGIDVQMLSSVQPGLEHAHGERAVPVARAARPRTTWTNFLPLYAAQFCPGQTARAPAG